MLEVMLEPAQAATRRSTHDIAQCFKLLGVSSIELGKPDLP